MTRPREIVIADDLTGAIEAAGALARLSTPRPEVAEVILDIAELRLDHDAAEPLTPETGGQKALLPREETTRTADIVAVDLDCRHLAPDDALDRLFAAIDAARAWARTDGRVIKKIDSLWRGNTATEVRALSAEMPAVLVPALPHLGRTVRGGALHNVADGAPSPGGHVDLVDLVGPRARTIELRVVRSGRAPLTAAIASAVRDGLLPVLDAETDSDLDNVAQALTAHPDWLLIGTGGIAAALGRTADRRDPARIVESDGQADHAPAPHAAHRDDQPTTAEAHRQIAVIVGSTEPTARSQIQRLVDAGSSVVELTDPHSRPLTNPALMDRPVAVFTSAAPRTRVDDGGPWARAVVDAALAQCRDADFVATGGATARALLDRLGVTRLQPIAEAHPAAVISRTPTGRLVGTRPGSFGGPESLAALVECIQTIRRTTFSNRKAYR